MLLICIVYSHGLYIFKPHPWPNMFMEMHCHQAPTSRCFQPIVVIASFCSWIVSTTLFTLLFFLNPNVRSPGSYYSCWLVYLSIYLLKHKKSWVECASARSRGQVWRCLGSKLSGSNHFIKISSMITSTYIFKTM
jgi:hypothetical protein